MSIHYIPSIQVLLKSQSFVFLAGERQKQADPWGLLVSQPSFIREPVLVRHLISKTKWMAHENDTDLTRCPTAQSKLFLFYLFVQTESLYVAGAILELTM